MQLWFKLANINNIYNQTWIEWFCINDNTNCLTYANRIYTILKQILDPCDVFDTYISPNNVKVGIKSVIEGVSGLYDS